MLLFASFLSCYCNHGPLTRVEFRILILCKASPVARSLAGCLKKMPVFSPSGHTRMTLGDIFFFFFLLLKEPGPGRVLGHLLEDAQTALCAGNLSEAPLSQDETRQHFQNLLLVSQESAPFLGQIKTIQSRLICLDFWICFCLFFLHFRLQSN